MARKLTRPDKKTYNRNHNELSEAAILECLSGTFKGRTRVIVGLYDLSKSPNADMHGPGKSLLAVGPTAQGTYKLDPDTDLRFDEKGGFFIFSSNNTEYMIRAIEDADLEGVATLAPDTDKDSNK